MFRLLRRFFWLVMGFALGAGSSWAVSRRFRRVAQRYVPAEMRDRWGDNMRAAVTEGRQAMRAREAELKGPSTANGAK